MTERIIEFLRGPVWRAHSIKSAEEAYVDLLACPAKERPRTITAMAERWNVERHKASKIYSKMVKLGLDPEEIDSMVDGTKSTNDGRKTTNDGTKTTNDGRKTTNDGTKTTNDGRKTTNDGRKTTNDGTKTTISPSRVNSNNIPHNISSPHNNIGVDEKVFDESLIPSAEEVQAYINATGGALFTGDAFVDYYTSRCLWNAQNVRPHVWQATVRTWRRRDKPPLQLPPSGGGHVASNPSTINSNPLTLNQKPYATTSYGRPSNGEAERDERRRSFAEHIRRQLQNPDDELEMPF